MAKPTRFTAAESLQIHQDDFSDGMTPLISHAPMPAALKAPRRPLQISNANFALHAQGTTAKAGNPSPFKSASRPPTSPLGPLKTSRGGKLNMVSFKPPSDPLRPTDSLPKKQPLMSRFKTVAQKAAVDPMLAYPGKENTHPTIYPAPPHQTLNLSIESYYQKPPAKRLLDPISTKDSRPQKKPRLEDGPLPPHDSFPTIADDGTKPGHSYAMLIGMAILRSPHRRLTLSQIYKWISDTYSFYNPQEAGWQNSIRHNLSLNKAFIKQERPKDDPGKGNYWAIEPGMEHQFMKEKPTRRSVMAADVVPVMSTILEPSLPVPPSLEAALPPRLPPMSHGLTGLPSTPLPAAMQPEASSDATIPISDTPAPDDVLERFLEGEIPLDSGLYSPLPAAMHSSPPIPRILDARGGTPPPAPSRPAGSSASRSHKRKFASMDDSGYISSLESSVLRSRNKGRLPTSEADRPRIKRGRAEEEIARLRASSYDSPTKSRAWAGFNSMSSSPLRPEGQMLPPLTPAVKLKVPARPPPSASPNTDLRIHRDRVRNMLASPLRRIPNDLDGRKLWGSPLAQKSSKPVSVYDDFAASLQKSSTPRASGFEIFQDDLSALFPALGDGLEAVTPERPPVQRLRFDRSHSASVLSDVSNSATRRHQPAASFLKMGQSPALTLDTPSRFFDNLPSSPTKFLMGQSPIKMPSVQDENAWITMDEFCNADLLQDFDEFGGMDILQGFEKIGATTQSNRPAAKGPPKPPLGRSFTTNF